MESFIDIIDHIAGPKIHSDPFQKFRRRAFVIMLLILAMVSLLQAITAWTSHQSVMLTGMMLVLCFFTVSCLIWTRGVGSIEHSGAIILSFLACMGTILELIAGRSPNTPLVFWSPVMIFGGFVFCGFERGIWVAVCLLLSALAIVFGPFVLNEALVLPGGGEAAGYSKRLMVTVVLCHAFPLFVLGMYEKFFHICHMESRELLDKIEGRKDRAFLGRLTRLIVAEMEPELERLEAGYAELHEGTHGAHAMECVLKPLHRLVYLTRRYEPLSIGALTAIERGLALEDFPGLIQRFTEFSRISIRDSEAHGLRFRGGQAFFLLVFLCISLRELLERPGVSLEEMILTTHSTRLDVDIVFQLEQGQHAFGLNQDFSHDLDAQVRFVAAPEAGGSAHFKINVPLGGPEGPQKV